MRPGGFEPPTRGLEGRRSSTELRALARQSVARLLRSLSRRPSCGELVAHDHLDRAGDRDRGERPENACELGADEHRDQHGERRQLHRPAVDDGLQEVVPPAGR